MAEYVEKCGHRSEVGGALCYLRAGHDRLAAPSPHNYPNCSWCSYTYEPCPFHEPTAHIEHEARERSSREAYIAARDELWRRAGELPEWAQRDLRLVIGEERSIPTPRGPEG